MKSTHQAAVSLWLLCLTGAAPAARIAYDGFNYGAALTNDALISAAPAVWAGTLGFNDSFVSANVNFRTAGLSYSGLTPGIGGALKFDINDTLTARPWGNAAAVPADGTYWYSFLFSPLSGGRGTLNIMSTTTSGNGQLGIGLRVDNNTGNSSGTDLLFRALSPAIDAFSSPITVTSGYSSTYLIVGRVDFNSTSGSTNRIWVNPAVTTPPSDASSVSISVDAAFSQTCRPNLVGRMFGGGGTLIYDEVRIGSSFAEVLPQKLALSPSIAVENQTLRFDWHSIPAGATSITLTPGDIDLLPFTTGGVGTTTLPAPAANTTYTLTYIVDSVPTSETTEFTASFFESVTATNNTKPVQVNGAPMNNGVLAYSDRYHTWAAVPTILQNAQFVKLGQDDKLTSNLQISFTAATDATFFLLLDNRIGDDVGGNNPAAGTDSPPGLGSGVMDWVLSSGFVDSGLDIGLDENPSGAAAIDRSYSVYFRQVSEGESYTFYQQNAGELRNMYGIAAVSPQVTPVAFVANPSTIQTGGSTTLQWTVPLGSTVSINQGIGDVTASTSNTTGVGSLLINPAATTIYTLTYDPPGANTPAVSLAPFTVTVTVPDPTPLAITEISVATNGDVSFSWPAPAGVTDPNLLTDVIERSTTLEALSWINITATGTRVIVNGVVSFTDTDPPAGGKAFYRIAR